LCHRDSHVAAYDDDAGAVVDHDLGRQVRLDLGEKRNQVAVIFRRFLRLRSGLRKSNGGAKGPAVQQKRGIDISRTDARRPGPPA
jgi:hypothetical protein